MNIFKILASGDGTLKEPCISSFFKFLLDPYGDHEMGIEFIKKFISTFDPIFANKLDQTYSIDLFLEENLTKEFTKLNKERKNIGDIYIEIKKDGIFVYLIYIEIKIKQSLNKKRNQVLAQIHDIQQFNTDSKVPKQYVFLTPSGKSYEEYYNSAADKINNKIAGISLSWEKDIIQMLEFNNTPGNLKYLLTCFKDFIKACFQSEYIEVKEGTPNYVEYNTKYLNNFSSPISNKVEYLLNSMIRIGYDHPKVTCRKVKEIKYIFRQKEGREFDFRLDINSSRIKCHLIVGLDKENIGERWVMDKINKSTGSMIFIQYLYPNNEIESLHAIVQDVNKNCLKR